MLLGALATIDTALKALNIPHGRGAVDAAANALAHTDCTA
jgi:alanine-glyoxylate transaminase/serine-glyoxylate transaminase/serine-pyruvate transaminase